MNLEQHQYYPTSIQMAKATMLFNLASAHALRSEWDNAGNMFVRGEMKNMHRRNLW